MIDVKKTRRRTTSIREVQKSQIREAILEAVVDRLAKGGLQRISVPEIAQIVGISARTVYRYFPSKAALIEAILKWSSQKMLGDSKRSDHISGPEEFIAHRQELFDHFDRHPNLVKAQLLSRVGREVRAIGSRKTLGTLDQALAELTSGLDPGRATRVKAAMYLLFSGEAWQHYRDVWRLDGRAAGETSAWVAQLIVKELRSERTREQPNRRQENGDHV